MKLRLCGLLMLASVVALGLGIGDKAPSFSVRGIDGKTYSSSELLKSFRAIAVLFVSVQCPYSNAYNERYRQLEKKLNPSKSRSVALLAVYSNQNETLEKIEAHAKKNAFAFPVIKDDGNKLADAFGAQQTPEVFLLDQRGRLIYTGRVDNDTEGKRITREDLVLAAQEYLAGTRVSVPETKAFGCSIKRK